MFSSAGLKLPRGFQFSLGGQAAKAEPAKEETQPLMKQPANLRAATHTVRHPAAEPPVSLANPPLQREPVLRTETVAVVADVIVTDRTGRHVRDLTAGDFRVDQDNAPQTITSFTAPGATDRPRRPKAPSRATTASPTRGSRSTSAFWT